jgi:hypothetical protein
MTRAIIIGVTALALWQGHPNLAGTWKLDVARSTSSGGGNGAGGGGTGGGRGGGLGLGPSADVLTIMQDEKTLTIDETRGERISRVVYPFDGKPSTNRLAAGRNAGGSSTAVSKWDAAKLVTIITSPAAPGTPGTVQYRDARWIDSDGFLIVETTAVGQANSRKAVYRKQ